MFLSELKLVQSGWQGKNWQQYHLIANHRMPMFHNRSLLDAHTILPIHHTTIAHSFWKSILSGITWRSLHPPNVLKCTPYKVFSRTHTKYWYLIILHLTWSKYSPLIAGSTPFQWLYILKYLACQSSKVSLFCLSVRVAHPPANLDFPTLPIFHRLTFGE